MKPDIQKNKPLVKDIAQKHDLKLVVLFGSAASGLAQDSSDIDIAVLRKDHTPLVYGSFLDISGEFSDALGAGFKKIDLVDLAQANILLRYEITRGGILLYGDETVYEDYRIFAFKDYLDSQSLRDLESALIKKRQDALADKINA